MPTRLTGNDWILGPFWGSGLWWAQSKWKIHCESISDTPEASKCVKNIVWGRFLIHVGPKIFLDSGMINKKHRVRQEDTETKQGPNAHNGRTPGVGSPEHRGQKWPSRVRQNVEAPGRPQYPISGGPRKGYLQKKNIYKTNHMKKHIKKHIKIS